jgi:hypothetical protein
MKSFKVQIPSKIYNLTLVSFRAEKVFEKLLYYEYFAIVITLRTDVCTAYLGKETRETLRKKNCLKVENKG